MSSTPWPFPKDHSHNGPLSLRQHVVHRARRWAQNRQGQDAATTTLTSRRVYILPTGVGVVYGLMTVAMLLGSMNYNNNLSFVLAFLLVSLGFVAMHVCQRNLVGLEISFAGVDPVHVGQTATFRFAVTNRAQSHRHHIQLYCKGAVSTVADLSPGESRVFELEVPTERRGWLRLSRFGVATLFPFDIMRSWAWLHMDLRALVFPAAAERAPDPPPSQTAQGHRQHDARGEEDFAGLRTFQDGDSPRHVAWKAYARGGELLSKRFAGADMSSQWLDFARIGPTDVEERLRILTRWVVDADRRQTDYGLRLPNTEFPPAHGTGHRHRCLEAIATFGDPAEATHG